MSADPLLQAARLWERTSAKGTRYMSGRLGGVKVVILPNRDYVEGDSVNSHTHILYFQDGSATSPRPAERAPAEPPERPRRKSPRQQIEDDVVPF
ncbi:MAG: hypothetical protein ABSC06_40215 [Rhodopila sp.]|jgi:hypothetical protein